MTGRRPSAGRLPGLTIWLAVVMIAIGVTMLGYVAWQLYGTNVVSHHRQAQNVERLRAQWASPAAATESSTERDGLELGDASALLHIPRFGMSWVMPVLEGTSDDVLSEGVGHFPDSATPGAVGNYALAGHRITHGEPFRDLPDLRPGDEVVVETRTATYTYVLDTDPNDLIVPFTSGWPIDPFPVNPGGGVTPDRDLGTRLITLTTCSELFHTDDRMIVFGHLQSVDHKS